MKREPAILFSAVGGVVTALGVLVVQLGLLDAEQWGAVEGVILAVLILALYLATGVAIRGQVTPVVDVVEQVSADGVTIVAGAASELPTGEAVRRVGEWEVLDAEYPGTHPEALADEPELVGARYLDEDQKWGPHLKEHPDDVYTGVENPDGTWSDVHRVYKGATGEHLHFEVGGARYLDEDGDGVPDYPDNDDTAGPEEPGGVWPPEGPVEVIPEDQR